MKAVPQPRTNEGMNGWYDLEHKDMDERWYDLEDDREV